MFGMFGGAKDLMQQMALVQKLMKDENFKQFISHPKVQELFKDPEFMKLLQSKDAQKIMSHPKLAVLREDEELRALLGKLDFQKLL